MPEALEKAQIPIEYGYLIGIYGKVKEYKQPFLPSLLAWCNLTGITLSHFEIDMLIDINRSYNV